MAPRPITAALLQSLFVGFNTRFRGGFAGVTPQWSQIATEVPSTGGEEEYSWLGNWPRIREWLGDRVINQLSAHGYTLKNRDFESTVEVKANDIKDDKLGIYGPMFQEYGRSVADFPDELIFALLAAGLVAKCYDGQPFFDDEHPVGDGVASNLTAGAGTPWFLMDTTRALKPLIYQNREAFALTALDKPDDPNVFFKNKFIYGTQGRCNAGFGFWQMAHCSKADLDAAGFETALAAMKGLTDDSGKKLGVRPNLLVVPSNLEGAARRLVKRSQVAGGASNEWEGAVEILVANYL